MKVTTIPALAGMLCGALIAVTAIVTIAGMPAITRNSGNPEIPTYAPSAQDRERPSLAAEIPTDRAEPVSVERATSASEPERQPLTDTTPANEPDTPVSDEELVEAIFAAPPDEPAAKFVDEAELSDERWYAFWSPFRSELAANGFVDHLQRTTGLDYRVVRQKIGVYEVAFSYAEDHEIEEKLATISAATGLEMPGG